MERFKTAKLVRILLTFAAIMVAAVFLLLSNSLLKKFREEEYHKMEIFAKAYETLNKAKKNDDLSLVLSIITSNKTIPIAILNYDGDINSTLNINIPAHADSVSYLKERVSAMRAKGNEIKLDYTNPDTNRFQYIYVCYDDSVLLKSLAVFPYIELAVLVIFIIAVISSLLGFNKSAQKSVWVGLSKETAHQLGTPISSLMAWTEILQSDYPDDEHIQEMGNDVKRLELIADRFSKIGSTPKREPGDLVSMLDRVINYMKRRSPDNVRFNFSSTAESLIVDVNVSLLEWVVENICKNAIDAMNGSGTLTIALTQNEQIVSIEISDTGKGIPKHCFKTVFQPGYTTKQRGWGLGLSLAKRIVSDYHKGKVFVKSSELGVGTTFRIELKK